MLVLIRRFSSLSFQDTPSQALKSPELWPLQEEEEEESNKENEVVDLLGDAYGPENAELNEEEAIDENEEDTLPTVSRLYEAELERYEAQRTGARPKTLGGRSSSEPRPRQSRPGDAEAGKSTSMVEERGSLIPREPLLPLTAPGGARRAPRPSPPPRKTPPRTGLLLHRPGLTPALPPVLPPALGAAPAGLLAPVDVGVLVPHARPGDLAGMAAPAANAPRRTRAGRLSMAPKRYGFE